MSEQEQKEEIAKGIYTDWNKDPKYTWETLPEYRKQTYRDWVEEHVLEVIGSAKER